jgi:hypothetical protein
VVPSTYGPHVEQVGWGVARQVTRALREQGVEDPLLDLLPQVAEQPGHLAYAVFRDRTATAVALVRTEGDLATYLGAVVAPGAEPGTDSALVVRALHDAANAGADWLAVPDVGFDTRPFATG